MEREEIIEGLEEALNYFEEAFAADQADNHKRICTALKIAIKVVSECVN